MSDETDRINWRVSFKGIDGQRRSVFTMFEQTARHVAEVIRAGGAGDVKIIHQTGEEGECGSSDECQEVKEEPDGTLFRCGKVAGHPGRCYFVIRMRD
jgi:hypothetical protein